MNRVARFVRGAIGAGLGLVSVTAIADGLDKFSAFTPLAISSAPTTDESQPITFGNPTFRQRSLADRNTQLAAGKPDSGNWDMITLNESRNQTANFLFTVFETGQAGVMRHDLRTGSTETVWFSPSASGACRLRRLFLDTVGNLHHGGRELVDLCHASGRWWGLALWSTVRASQSHLGARDHQSGDIEQ